MTDNPFATPTAPVQPPAREVPATTQPYAFIAVLRWSPACPSP